MLLHWVHRLLLKSMRYLIGLRNQTKAYCFSSMKLMLSYASKMLSLLFESLSIFICNSFIKFLIVLLQT